MRIAIVTGAASGIGRAIALAMGREGARVALLDLNGEGAAGIAREIGAAAGEAQAWPLDVAGAARVASVVDDVVRRLGAVHVYSSDPRQLRHAQDAAHPVVVEQASALSSALHADRGVVDQPRRALVRHAHRQADPPRRALQHADPRDGDHRILAATNDQPRPFRWTKAADEILASGGRFCRRISDSRD